MSANRFHWDRRKDNGDRPLVLLSGWACDSEIWKERPFGRPILHTYTPDPDAAVDDIIHQTSGPFDLAGWSLGGRLALRIWRQYPDQVGRCTLYSMGNYTAERLERQRVLLRRDRSRYLYTFYRRCFLGAAGDFSQFEDAHLARLLDRWPEKDLLAGLDFLAAPCPEVPSHDGELVHYRGDRDRILDRAAPPVPGLDAVTRTVRGAPHAVWTHPDCPGPAV